MQLTSVTAQDGEYDFVFIAVRAMKFLGLVEASPAGKQKPEGVPPQSDGL
jgi:hypothetical protein